GETDEDARDAAPSKRGGSLLSSSTNNKESSSGRGASSNRGSGSSSGARKSIFEWVIKQSSAGGTTKTTRKTIVDTMMPTAWTSNQSKDNDPPQQNQNKGTDAKRDEHQQQGSGGGGTVSIISSGGSSASTSKERADSHGDQQTERENFLPKVESGNKPATTSTTNEQAETGTSGAGILARSDQDEKDLPGTLLGEETTTGIKSRGEEAGGGASVSPVVTRPGPSSSNSIRRGASIESCVSRASTRKSSSRKSRRGSGDRRNSRDKRRDSDQSQSGNRLVSQIGAVVVNVGKAAIRRGSSMVSMAGQDDEELLGRNIVVDKGTLRRARSTDMLDGGVTSSLGLGSIKAGRRSGGAPRASALAAMASGGPIP
ncbi:unnamed protein product, partial [Amoebophrya sp. A25]